MKTQRADFYTGSRGGELAAIVKVVTSDNLTLFIVKMYSLGATEEPEAPEGTEVPAGTEAPEGTQAPDSEVTETPETEI